MTSMIFPTITAYLTIFLTLVVTVLAFRVSVKRQNEGVNFGEGENSALTRVIRTHGNLTESAPFVLISLALAEAGGSTPLFIIIIAIIYAVSRVCHIAGMAQGAGNGPLRAVGGLGTLVSLLASAVALFLVVI